MRLLSARLSVRPRQDPPMNKLYLNITADTNDADYVSNMTEITADKLAELMPLIKAIKNFKTYKTKSKDGSYERSHSHNWPTGDCLRQDLGEKSPEEYYGEQGISEDLIMELSENFLPHGEYGIHTIKSIEVLHIAKREKLYEHVYGR